MKTKNQLTQNTILVVLSCALLLFLPNWTQAKTKSSFAEVELSKNQSKVSATVLISRLNEINDLRKSNLSSNDKSTLKKEVRNIKHELSKIDNGIYLSTGALLLILILIIIL